jgi:hypothetical protein
MNNSYTFACGQGATKAMLHCIEQGTLDWDYCCIVNSTVKDIPEKYRRDSIVISEDPEAGCGKVRSAAKRLMLEYLKKNPNEVLARIPDDAQYVNIMTTTEGASGSGASVVLAKYIKSQIDIPIIITLICGFESDTRGLQNTIDYFKDLKDGDFIIRTVSNKRFLEKTNNTFTAEKMANEDISNGFKVINAFDIVDSEQNIDATDHYKLITNPGLMFVTEVPITRRLKNPNQFDQLISDAIDYSSSLDFEPSATKIGVFLNMSDDNLAVIDTNFTAIKKKLCGNTAIEEFFIHRQSVIASGEFVRIIASGINLPKDELMEMYTKYQDSIVKNDKEDDFFTQIGDMDTSIAKQSTKRTSTDTNFFDEMDTGASEEDEVVIRRSRKRAPAGFSGTPNTATDKPVEGGGTYEKKRGFTAKKSAADKTEQPYSEDAMKGF